MHKDQNKQTLIYFFFLIVKHPPPPIYLYMPIPLGKKIKSRMTRIAPVLYTGLIFYKALYCQRTTGMSGSNDQPWPPTQILGCVSPLSKIWLWLSSQVSKTRSWCGSLKVTRCVVPCHSLHALYLRLTKHSSPQHPPNFVVCDWHFSTLF